MVAPPEMTFFARRADLPAIPGIAQVALTHKLRDEREALVTSANFTHRAQDRNVEVGALIRDPRFARALAAQ